MSGSGSLKNHPQIRNWKYDFKRPALEIQMERFSTVPFNLNSLDNQIHLTNNAIQRNFDISNDCHEEIPEQKMWSCDELDTYLKSIGRGNAYARKIFPAMKKILIQTCLAAQETAEPRKRRFVCKQLLDQVLLDKMFCIKHPPYRVWKSDQYF